jgi:predicted GIY-YIG superfamily endonuclease
VKKASATAGTVPRHGQRNKEADMVKRKASAEKTITIEANHFDRLRETTHILYRCFTRKKVLLYVGMTNHIERRIESHRRDKPWWPYVDHITLQSVKSRKLLVEAESAAIESEKPRFNVQGGSAAVPSTPRSPGLARTLWPHASNFCTVIPDDQFLINHTLEQQLYPCVECHARAIYAEGDTVACGLCSSEWEFDKWFAMTFKTFEDTPVGKQIPLM